VTGLAGLTSPDARDRAAAGALLVIPVGSTEQHGPHLPLSTDTDLACTLSARLAQARPGVLVAPPVAYGSSGEHQDFAGTLSIGGPALEMLLVELCRSATVTFARILLVCTHGGNAEAVLAAVRKLRGEGRAVTAWMPTWDGDAHAGRAETSMQLALAPERVRAGLAAAGNTRPLAELMPSLRAGGVRSVSPNGVLGDPRGASAAEGAAILSELLASLLTTADGCAAQPTASTPGTTTADAGGTPVPDAATAAGPTPTAAAGPAPTAPAGLAPGGPAPARGGPDTPTRDTTLTGAGEPSRNGRPPDGRAQDGRPRNGREG
jgi:mycofactocin precursor peptide peptidase